MSSEKQPPSKLGRQLLAAAQQDTSWLVRIGDDSERRLTTGEIVDAYNDRLIEPETYVWTDGMRSWQQLQAVDDLVDALHAEASRYSGGVAQASEPEQRASGPAPGEDSAIFSLSMLIGHSEHQEAAEVRTEDSGLIDLAAMTASAPPLAEDKPPASMLSAGLFTLPASAPVQTAPRKPSAAPGNNRLVVGGLIAVVTVLSATLVFQVVRTQGTTAASPSTTAATIAAAKPTAPPPHHEAPTPSPEPSSQPADSAPAASNSGAAADKEPDATRRQPTPVRSAPVTPPTPPTPPPTKKGCVCEDNDLMCQMRCATNR